MHLKLQCKVSRRWLLPAAITALMSGTAHAEPGDIEWNGFLNVVGGYLKKEPVKNFEGTKQYPSFQGYEHSLTFEPQTSAGLQAQKKLDEETAVTMQVYSEGDVEGYQANLKWLYLTYTPSYQSTFRIGRLGTPVYYYSDFLNVGYSYHWILPPEPVYPFDTTITGINYVYQNVWKDIEWSAEAVAGSADEYLPLIESQVTTRNNFGLAFSASTGNWLSARLMYYRADTTFDMDALDETSLNAAIEENVELGLTNLGLTPEQIAGLLPVAVAAARPKILDEDLKPVDFPMNYLTLALRAETDRWLLMSEISTIQTDTYLFADVITRYLTGGLRFGPVLYHMTVAEAKSVADDGVHEDRHYTLPEAATLEDYTDLLAARFKSTLAGSVTRNINTVSLGARIETSDNTAVKFEITRIEEQPLFDGDTYATGKNLLFRTALNATF